jgi:acetylglutamate kinase
MRVNNKLTIVKVGGKIVEEPASLQQLLKDFTAINGLKILVHGGGRSATAIATKLGVESKMVNGRRVTDEAMLEIVTMVYGGLVNKKIVAGLQSLGINAVGLTGADLNYMVSEKRPVREVDYGYVGDVKQVNASILADLIGRGVVPVLAPLTHDAKGLLLNTNADTIAAEAAKALTAYFEVTLIYCFEKAGVLRDENDDDSVIAELTPSAFTSLVKEGVIQGGMIPKLENAFASLQAGLNQVVITRADRLEDGCGTSVIL